MRTIFTIIAILSGMCLGQAQENRPFFYKYEERIYLDQIENIKVIHFRQSIKPSQRDYICDQLRASDYKITEISPFSYSVSGDLTQLKDSHIISTAKKDNNILYVSDMLMNKDSTILWPSNDSMQYILDLLETKSYTSGKAGECSALGTLIENKISISLSLYNMHNKESQTDWLKFMEDFNFVDCNERGFMLFFLVPEGQEKEWVLKFQDYEYVELADLEYYYKLIP